MKLSIPLWACAFVIWVALPCEGSGTQGGAGTSQGSEIQVAEPEPSTKKKWFSKTSSKATEPGSASGSGSNSPPKPLTKKEKKAQEKAKKKEEENKKKKPPPREPRIVYGYLTDGQVSSFITMIKAMLDNDMCADPQKASAAKTYCPQIVDQLNRLMPEMRPADCPHVTAGACINGVCSLKVYKKTKGCGIFPCSETEPVYRNLSSCVNQPVEVPPQYYY